MGKKTKSRTLPRMREESARRLGADVHGGVTVEALSAPLLALEQKVEEKLAALSSDERARITARAFDLARAEKRRDRARRKKLARAASASGSPRGAALAALRENMHWWHNIDLESEDGDALSAQVGRILETITLGLETIIVRGSVDEIVPDISKLDTVAKEALRRLRDSRRPSTYVENKYECANRMTSMLRCGLPIPGRVDERRAWAKNWGGYLTVKAGATEGSPFRLRALVKPEPLDGSGFKEWVGIFAGAAERVTAAVFRAATKSLELRESDEDTLERVVTAAVHALQPGVRERPFAARDQRVRRESARAG